MDLYTTTSYQLAEQLTKRYSTSFSASSRLFAATTRPHIYAIYGLVRVADEIVDTYRGTDAGERLGQLNQELARALKTGFSPNPIVHAFAATARAYSIQGDLITPFFDSMASDIIHAPLNHEQYRHYIYGSAEVIGLMCLKVFTKNDTTYHTLAPGARALGAAYQKVNFLRDIKADHDTLGRVYFPSVTYDTFNDAAKAHIIADIKNDLAIARPALRQLPKNCRRAVNASRHYYTALLKKLEHTPAAELKQRRLRIAGVKKLWLYAAAKVGR